MKKVLNLFTLLSVTLLFSSCGYNQMVSMQEGVDQSWANVQSSYQRRADLIPNLVSTVKGYAEFEKETLTGVIEARAKATQTTIDPSNLTTENLKQFQAAQGELSGALSRLLVTVERYPDLKANQNFLQLQQELVDTEDKIQASRRFYNGGVRDLNTKIQVFPNNVFAGMLGFTQREFFEVEDRATAENPVDVQF